MRRHDDMYKHVHTSEVVTIPVEEGEPASLTLKRATAVVESGNDYSRVSATHSIELVDYQIIE